MLMTKNTISNFMFIIFSVIVVKSIIIKVYMVNLLSLLINHYKIIIIITIIIIINYIKSN